MKSNEIWKDIKGYEGLYQVSNYGNVRSLDRIINKKDGTSSQIKGKNIFLRNNNNGYYQCALHKNGKTKYFYIHSLVAQTFLEKTNFKSMPNENKKIINLNKLEINHKDENPSNNNLENLEFCTHLYNMNYGTAKERIKKSNINNTKLNKKVNQYDLDGNFIKTWQSMSEIQRQLGVFKQAIYQCCTKKKKTAGGYIWRYADERGDEE